VCERERERERERRNRQRERQMQQEGELRWCGEGTCEKAMAISRESSMSLNIPSSLFVNPDPHS
jgi:hypothetical protein